MDSVKTTQKGKLKQDVENLQDIIKPEKKKKNPIEQKHVINWQRKGKSYK